MSDGTKIEWTDATWNPITGCSVVSPGCTNCYAMKLAGGRLKHRPSRAGLTVATKAGPVWNGQVRLNEEWLTQPLSWGRPRRVFVCAHGDLFHESVPDEWIDKVFGVMSACDRHTFQVLTKRPERMLRWFETRTPDEFFPEGNPEEVNRWKVELRGTPQRNNRGPGYDNCGLDWPLRNVWLGVSVEDQKRADERIPLLLRTPAAVRWLSCEPLLSALALQRWLSIDWQCSYCQGYFTGAWTRRCPDCGELDGLSGSHAFNGRGYPEGTDRGVGIDWIVAGGESGHGARPMHPEWARSLRDQCIDARVPFFFKQWGAFAPGVHGPNWDAVPNYPHLKIDDPRLNIAQVTNVGKKAAGRELDGRTWNEYPVAA